MPAKKPTGVPRQAIPHGPLAAFVASEINRDALKSIATNPAFLAACHYIAQQVAITTHDAMVLTDQALRAKASAQHIALHFPEMLMSLVEQPARVVEPLAWDHIEPPTQ